MSKIKDLLEELAEIVMNKARDENIHNDFEQAQTLQIITTALVELGESTSVEQEIDNKFITLQTVDWQGNDSIIIKFKQAALMGYNESLQDNGNLNGIKLLEVQLLNMMYFVKMTEEELIKILYGN